MFKLNWNNVKKEAASIKQSIRWERKKLEFIFHLSSLYSK